MDMETVPEGTRRSPSKAYEEGGAHPGASEAGASALERALIEVASGPVVLLDAALHVRMANARFYDTFGLTPAEIDRRSVQDLDAEAGSALRTLLLDVVPRRPQVRDYQVELRAASGKRTYMVNAHRLPEDAGTLLAFQDVTECRQAAERVRRERDTAQRYLEVAGVVMVALDDRGRVTLVNPKGCEVLGLAEDEIVGKDWFDHFVPPAIRERARATFADLMGGRHSGAGWYEGPMVTRSGEVRYFLWHTAIVRDAGARITGLLASGTDVTQRRAAETALRESEQRYRTVVDNQTELVCRFLPDTTLTFVNEAYRKHFGAGDLIGRKFLDLIPSADHASVLEHVEWLVAHPAAVKIYEHEVLGPDGQRRWQEWIDRPVLDDEGRVIEFQSVGRDVTARHEAEQALRESERRFRSLFEACPDAVLVEDLEGRVLDVNPAGCRLHQADRETLVGMSVRDLAPPEQRAAVRDAFDRLLNGDVDYLQSLSWTLDGRAVPVEIRASRFHYRGVLAALLIVRDLTDRLAVEEALRESRARAQVILDNTVDGIITIDTDRIIETVNASVERIFGYTAGELVGQNVKMLIPPPHRDAHDWYVRRYLEAGQRHMVGVGGEAIAQRKDGSTFPVDIFVSEVVLNDRRRFIGFIRDISERRRLEQEVLRISDDERQRIGRDIHDGLASQFGGIAMLGRGLVNQWHKQHALSIDTLEEIAHLARRGADQARALARGLNPVHLDRGGLEASVKEFVHNAQLLSNTNCLFEARGDLPTLPGNVASQLYRIAQEAVNNAVKHAGAENIAVRLYQEDDRLVLAVADDGDGLPDDLRNVEGMGLHIMPYRARMINATLGIESSPGAGTTITCTVPIDGGLPSNDAA